MHHKNMQKIPFSFARDKPYNLDKITEKYTHQLQTNEASDTTQFIELKNQSDNQKNYKKLVKSLHEQNQYYKQALNTAQNLIKNYQHESNNLRSQNVRLLGQLNEVTVKLQNLERLLLKVFQCQKKANHVKTQVDSPKDSDKNRRQNLKTFYNNEDDSQYLQNVQHKISKIIDQQFKYQQQIFDLNKKIKHLSKLQNQSNFKQIERNKIKTSTNLPFKSDDGLKRQKQIMKNQVLDIYGNERTIKTIHTKQSQFRKNLQKQFEAFLTSKRNSTKSKNSVSKILFTENKQSGISISASTQKKNKRKTISLSKNY